MKENSLRKAGRLFKARRFSDVIRLLEPQVFRFRENYYFFYYLGISCLFSGDFGGAYSYLKRAHQISPENINAMAGLAVVHLKKQETHEALQLWLQITDLEPGNQIAKRGLSLLRKHKGNEDLSASLETGKLKRLFPSPGAYIPTWILAIFLIAGISGFGYFAVPALVTMSDDYGKGNRTGLDTSAIALPDTGSLQELKGQYRYIMNDSQIRETMKKAVEYFYDYRDNMVRREINRITLSNATIAVKEKAGIIAVSLKEPSFTDIKDTFSYAEIRKESVLYENCFVKWRGRVTNVKNQQNIITFDFLVGYEDGKILEGTVPAYVTFPVDLRTEVPLEVLGQIKIKDNIISLRVTSIHQLVP